MAEALKSREHHWWPVGLQKYWMDKNGDVSWIEPDGTIHRKRVKRRKIAYKSHGHTILKGSVWETNFENDFLSSDDGVPKVIRALSGLKPLGRTLPEFLSIMSLFFKKNRTLRDMCKFYHLDEEVHRTLLLVLFSLLIRSPANRIRYESYPSMFGLPPNEDVGKVNMRQNFHIAKRLSEKNSLSNQYFILIHASFRNFVFGDGNLDWITGGLIANRIRGRALVPLTPQLCVYFCTPRSMPPTPNCASFTAAPWMVDWINNIVQIYSQDKLFFTGRPPTLTEAFRERQFREHARKTDELIDMLDDVAGNKSSLEYSLLGSKLWKPR